MLLNALVLQSTIVDAMEHPAAFLTAGGPTTAELRTGYLVNVDAFEMALQQAVDVGRYDRSFGISIVDSSKGVNVWLTESESGSGQTYFVGRDDDGAFFCECPDFYNRAQPCKHIIGAVRVLHATGVLDAKTVQLVRQGKLSVREAEHV